MPKGRHFGSQNGRKIDLKMRSKFKSEKVASWDRLGSILGRFGACPEGIFIDFLLVFVIFREHRRFRCKTGPKTVWGRNLAENDAKLGSQNDPKSIQNRYRKLIQILIDFWIDLGASWGDLRALLGGSWAPKRRDQSFPDRGFSQLDYLALGPAAEAWALPCTFRRKSTIDFEEIERLYSLNE